jgi:hypothetical protein
MAGFFQNISDTFLEREAEADALASQIAAAASEASALVSKDAAAASAVQAGSSATSSASDVNTTAASATASEVSNQASLAAKAAALVAQAAAETAEGNAAGSESNSAASSASAAASATASEASKVTSVDSASTSTTKAAAALTSETNAATSATTATTKASDSETARAASVVAKDASVTAKDASVAAQAAAVVAKNASVAAQAAAETAETNTSASASTATTKASESSASASAASTSEGNASTSATGAASSASGATSSASAAASSATASANSATAAASSAASIGTDPSFNSVTVTGSTAVKMPVGTTAQRPTPVTGQLRYNSTLSAFEGYTTEWGEIGGGGSTDISLNTFTGDGSDLTFSLSAAAAENNTFVYISGVYQNKSTYAVSAADPAVVTFSTAPPNGTAIEIMSAAISVTSVGVPSDNTITTAKIADAAVTTAKLAAGVGGAFNNFLVKTANYTAVTRDQLIVNSSSAVTITLPASPSAGNIVFIKNAGSGTVTVARNGSNINSTADDGSLAADAGSSLVYVGSTIGWKEL